MSRAVLLPVAGGAAALLIVGFVIGAVGAAMLGRDAFLPVPQVHLAPQPIACLGGTMAGTACEGGFAVTNTLLSAWATTLVILLVFVGGTRAMRLVPGRLQSLIEMLIEALYGFITSVAGERNGRRFFPLLMTIFLFVAFNAWMALLPIYPSVGFTAPGADHVTTHLFRSAGTDVNMPLALALVSFAFVEIWGLRVHGIGYLREFVRLGGLFGGLRRLNPGQIFYGLVDAAIGLLELLSHLIRLLSFTFRLFGNMLAGEIVLFMVTFLVIFLAPIAFYFLEILVGGVQALIFTGLSLVFAVMAVAPHAAHDEEHHADAAHEAAR
ncbi:MAG: F0F1 ATP synthase subunit A [Dehalococcoidia bacterium]|nr:F0F1 ATP synthase subunit A [Dehalococcoidia bacterium]